MQFWKPRRKSSSQSPEMFSVCESLVEYNFCGRKIFSFKLFQWTRRRQSLQPPWEKFDKRTKKFSFKNQNWQKFFFQCFFSSKNSNTKKDEKVDFLIFSLKFFYVDLARSFDNSIEKQLPDGQKFFAPCPKMIRPYYVFRIVVFRRTVHRDM